MPEGIRMSTGFLAISEFIKYAGFYAMPEWRGFCPPDPLTSLPTFCIKSCIIFWTYFIYVVQY